MSKGCNEKTKVKNNRIKEIINNKENFFTLDAETKYDYEFLKKIFLTFKRDKNFLYKVYRDIMKNVNELWVLEFSLRMKEILTKSNDHKIVSEIQAQIIEYTMEIMKQINKYKETNDISFGLGFETIKYNFDYSEIIMDHFGKILIKQIFFDWNIEKRIHSKYGSYARFESENPNLKKYIIKTTALYDSLLGHYLITHYKIAKEVEYLFSFIKANWHNYIIKEKEEVVEAIIETCANYIQNHGSKDLEQMKRLENIFLYVCYQYGLEEIILKYAQNNLEEYVKYIRNIKMVQKIPNIKIMMDYLYFDKVIRKNLNQITDYVSKREMSLKLLTKVTKDC